MGVWWNSAVEVIGNILKPALQLNFLLLSLRFAFLGCWVLCARLNPLTNTFLLISIDLGSRLRLLNSRTEFLNRKSCKISLHNLIFKVFFLLWHLLIYKFPSKHFRGEISKPINKFIIKVFITIRLLHHRCSRW